MEIRSHSYRTGQVNERVFDQATCDAVQASEPEGWEHKHSQLCYTLITDESTVTEYYGVDADGNVVTAMFSTPEEVAL